MTVSLLQPDRACLKRRLIHATFDETFECIECKISRLVVHAVYEVNVFVTYIPPVKPEGQFQFQFLPVVNSAKEHCSVKPSGRSEPPSAQS